MSSTDDEVKIMALLQKVSEAHAGHDAAAIVGAYAPNAVIFDLAPPLGRRGVRHNDLVEWLGSWEGPIHITMRNVEITARKGLAFVSAFCRMRGRQAGEDQDLWYRSVLCLEENNDEWRIVCDHSSVPFYMDGSYRAAVDLEP